MKCTYLICLLALFLTGCAMRGQDTTQRATVILKLDDLRVEEGRVPEGWQEVFTYLNQAGVVATLGLIGNSLEEDNQPYYDWIISRHQEGHEIWNHGYCHCKPDDPEGEELTEFRGTDLAYQLDHIQRTQQLAESKLGFPLRSFGAPFNATDSTTAAAIHQFPSLLVWMYKADNSNTARYLLPRTAGVNIEYPTHVPSFDKFLRAYRSNRNAPVLVIQGHPQSWVGKPERLQDFKRIVHYLIDDGAQFTTPYAYYLAQRGE